MPENKLNKRYLVRIIERAGVDTAKTDLNKATIILGINPPREELKKRIESRVQLMLKAGVLEEVKRGADLYGWSSEAMTGGIYKVFKGFVSGEKTLEQATEDIIISDLHLVKKQMTWFRRNENIVWFADSRLALDWFDQAFSGKL
jgi:tRNA dimethylallyltransferase